jgi:hypothetical protein
MFIPGAECRRLWGGMPPPAWRDEANCQPNEQGNIPTENNEGKNVTIVN